MDKKLFSFTFCVIFTFALIVVYNGPTHNMPEKRDIDESPYVEVHGFARPVGLLGKHHCHVHCVGYAHDNMTGNYTIVAMNEWVRDNPPDITIQGRFEGGLYKNVALNIKELFENVTIDEIENWSGSAAVEQDATEEKEGVTVREYKDNEAEEEEEGFGDAGTDSDEAMGMAAVDNNLGISPTNSNQIPSPGNTYEFKVVTETPYYWIDVFVKAPAPLDTSEKGTEIGDGVLGDGTSTESTFEYTIPTGTSAAFGDYLITAEIWRGTDMSKYTETYTFTVSSD